MDKITQALHEALKEVLPADQISGVAKALESMIAEETAQIEADFRTKLEEAYETAEEEVNKANAIRDKGYMQAYEVITAQQKMIDELQEAHRAQIDEVCEEAYGELTKVKESNKNFEMEVVKEFDAKLEEMKETLVDRIDGFLTHQEAVHYAAAQRHVMNDPRTAEHKVVIDRVAEVLEGYLGDVPVASSNKLDEATRRIEDLQAHIKMLEHKNVRLGMNNSKLSEQVKEAHGLLTEAQQMNRKERANKAQKASGRGNRAGNAEQILTEFAAPVVDNSNNAKHEVRESHDPLNDLLVLSGLSDTSR